MPFRGSLRTCIEQLADRFRTMHDDALAIMCCDSGKYYTAATEQEMTEIATGEHAAAHRLVFAGSARELAAFTTSNQLALDLIGDECDNPETDPTGKLGDGSGTVEHPAASQN
jgi:hypothetical protein